MKATDQLITPAQATQISELGISWSHSLFYFAKLPKKYCLIVGNTPVNQHCLAIKQNLSKCDTYYSAFTVAELGIMLPEYIQSKLNSNGKKKKGEEWYCTMIYNHKRFPGVTEDNFLEFTAPTEAKARAKMLIAGIEQGYPGFSIKEINKRLSK